MPTACFDQSFVYQRIVLGVAVLDESTLKVAALEISSGPLDDLIDGRFFATSFDVKSYGTTGHVTIPCKES